MADELRSRPLRNPRHERFCQLWARGNPLHDPEDPLSPPDTLGVGTTAYVAAGYQARGHGAAVNASLLLRRADVQARIRAIRSAIDTEASVMVASWLSMMPEAQRVVRKALRGQEVSAAELAAAKLVVDRAEGPLTFRFRDKEGKERALVPLFVYGANTDEGPPIEVLMGQAERSVEGEDEA
jgi:hypothetical protein